MGLIFGLLTSPVLGGPRLAHWLAGTVAEETQRQALDEGSVRANLLQLQELYEAGELSDEEYDSQERALLEQLNAIREHKEM